MTLTLATHSIPLWFLVLSLFLPRVCIFVAWLQHGMGHYIPANVSILDIVVAVLIPRLLILFWIYSDQGISIWFVIHVIALRRQPHEPPPPLPRPLRRLSTAFSALIVLKHCASTSHPWRSSSFAQLRPLSES